MTVGLRIQAEAFSDGNPGLDLCEKRQAINGGLVSACNSINGASFGDDSFKQLLLGCRGMPFQEIDTVVLNRNRRGQSVRSPVADSRDDRCVSRDAARDTVGVRTDDS